MKPKLILLTAQNLASANMIYPTLRQLHADIDRVVILHNVPISDAKGIKAFIRLVRRCAFSFLLFKFLEIWAHYLVSLARGELVDQLCRKYHVTTHHFGSADDLAFLALLEQHSPDYLVSTGPAILRTPVIKTAQKAVLNCHGARLPRYRGPANYIWTFLNGETTRNATIHRLVEKIDAGAIWKEASFPIDPVWSVYEYNYHHSLDCGKLLAATLQELVDGKEITEIPQDETQAVARSFPTGADMVKFRTLGIPLWRISDLWRCSGFPELL